MSPPPDDHACVWKGEAERLSAELERLRGELGEVDKLRGELDALKRHVFGKKRERVEPLERAVRKKRPPDPERAKQVRAERALAKQRLESTEVEHPVLDEQKRCSACKGMADRPLDDHVSVEYEYVPERFRKRVHRRQTLACACGEHVVTAPAPARVAEKTTYGPGFVAHVVVSKCADAIPLYRMEKHYGRLGIPIARSTLCDLFHRAARELAPLAARVLERVAARELVWADETPHRMQGAKGKKVYVWTFLDDRFVAYVFSESRGGDTPKKVLGASKGRLVVDAYTGYNPVLTPERRKRAGCLAHARRKFFDALPTAPEARRAIDLLHDVYVVEHDAREAGVLGTEAHLRMRQERSRPLMNALHGFLEEEKPKHLPKGPMGKAIAYALENWEALTAFLDDASLPLDNNHSEAALRIVALGRANYLFVGHKKAGENLCTLLTLVRSAERCGVNPLAYLTDVLVRVQTHPASDLDALLPDRWRPAAAPS